MERSHDIEEYQSIMKNDVWEIVPRPKEKSMVTSKWVYKIKHVVDISVEKYKERFVARGFPKRRGSKSLLQGCEKCTCDSSVVCRRFILEKCRISHHPM
jgi:hypothetical protein